MKTTCEKKKNNSTGEISLQRSLLAEHWLYLGAIWRYTRFSSNTCFTRQVLLGDNNQTRDDF